MYRIIRIGDSDEQERGMVMYSGDEFYDDDVTSPLYQPVLTTENYNDWLGRVDAQLDTLGFHGTHQDIPQYNWQQSWIAGRTAAGAAHAAISSLSESEYQPSNDAEDRYNRGGW